ncbi:MAG TPA: helix-hairpin-helix domain-containing protein, partial [Chitinophagaceae bacterium]|nr:helix-hairpin-helix domain-containing protein [Chitinophagaceae bacterium]
MKFFYLFWVLAAGLAAQAQDTGQELGDLQEELARTGEANPSFSETAALFRRRPLNLNEAEESDLQLFPFLNPLQIRSFLTYRRLAGKLLDIYELQAVPGWDAALVARLLPYVRVADPEPLTRTLLSRLRNGQQAASFRWERKTAEDGGRYAGSPVRVQFRYKYTTPQGVQAGWTGEKDAGEVLLGKGSRPALDFHSVHFFARKLGLVQALALGDFTVSLGQGLTHWQSYGNAKSADVLNIKRQSPVLRPYHGFGEVYFSRGAGLALKRGNWEAAVFLSRRHLDASFTGDSLDDLPVFSSISVSGLHRTEEERARKGNLGYGMYGGAIHYQQGSLRAGINMVHHRFSAYYIKEGFQGRNGQNASMDYAWNWRNLHLFGEAAAGPRGGWAWLHGVLASLHPKADLGLLWRHLSPQYRSLWGAAFTEAAAPGNEQGWYAGLRLRPDRHWQLDAYIDRYRFPAVKYGLDAPGRGQEVLFQATWRPVRGVECYTRLRWEEKENNRTDTSGNRSFVSGLPRISWRTHLSFSTNTNWNLKQRVEAVWLEDPITQPKTGFLMYTEAALRTGAHFRSTIRIQYFQLPGFEGRVYVLEP